MSESQATVLIVHPDETERDRMMMLLEGAGYACAGTAYPGEAISYMAQGPDLVLVDASLRDAHGNLLAARLKAANEGRMCVVLTGAASRQDMKEALEAEVCEVLPRGASDDELLAAVAEMLALKQEREADLRERESIDPVPVAVVCDNTILRRGLTAVLTGDPGLTLAGYFETVDEFLAAKIRPVPKLVLMCGSCNFVRFETGLSNVNRIAAIHPDARIAIFNQKMPVDRQIALLKMGIGGFLETEWPEEKFCDLLRRIHHGHIVAREEIMVRALRELSQEVGRRREMEPKQPEGIYLTNREKEVIRLIARGMKNRDIGRELFISEKTVKTHVNNIMKKLEVGNRIQAVHKAMEMNLL